MNSSQKEEIAKRIISKLETMAEIINSELHLEGDSKMTLCYYHYFSNSKPSVLKGRDSIPRRNDLWEVIKFNEDINSEFSASANDYILRFELPLNRNKILFSFKLHEMIKIERGVITLQSDSEENDINAFFSLSLLQKNIRTDSLLFGEEALQPCLSKPDKIKEKTTWGKFLTFFKNYYALSLHCDKIGQEIEQQRKFIK